MVEGVVSLLCIGLANPNQTCPAALTKLTWCQVDGSGTQGNLLVQRRVIPFITNVCRLVVQSCGNFLCDRFGIYCSWMERVQVSHLPVCAIPFFVACPPSLVKAVTLKMKGKVQCSPLCCCAGTLSSTVVVWFRVVLFVSHSDLNHSEMFLSLNGSSYLAVRCEL